MINKSQDVIFHLDFYFFFFCEKTCAITVIAPKNTDVQKMYIVSIFGHSDRRRGAITGDSTSVNRRKTAIYTSTA